LFILFILYKIGNETPLDKCILFSLLHKKLIGEKFACSRDLYNKLGGVYEQFILIYNKETFLSLRDLNNEQENVSSFMDLYNKLEDDSLALKFNINILLLLIEAETKGWNFGSASIPKKSKHKTLMKFSGHWTWQHL